MSRTRKQQGSVTLDARTGKWWFRYRDRQGRRRAVFVGNIKQYPSQERANAAAIPLRAKLNCDAVPMAAGGVTFSEIADKFIAEELPERSAEMYLSRLKNHVLPQWGSTFVAQVQPLAVELWLKGLPFAHKTKVHLRSLLHLLVESAQRRGLVELGRNPIGLVRIQGSRPNKGPKQVLNMKEFAAVLAGIPEPFKLMVVLAQCLGLRSCEVVGLKWSDVDWANLLLHVRRSVRGGKVWDSPKTESSAAALPLDPAVAELLLAWRRQATFVGDADWVFASPHTAGEMPYVARGVQQRHIRPAMDAQGLDPKMGWHTFRHTYRTLLSATGAALDVTRDLMRHASITTSYDVYGTTYPEPLRDANKAVCAMVPKG